MQQINVTRILEYINELKKEQVDILGKGCTHDKARRAINELDDLDRVQNAVINLDDY